MALSFPASPIIGDVYQHWRWSGSSWDMNNAPVVESWSGQYAKTGAVTMTAADLQAAGGVLLAGHRTLIQSNKITGNLQYVALLTPPANNLIDYDIYEVEWFGLIVSANGNINLQISHDGTTWEQAGQYYEAYSSRDTGNTDYSWGGLQPYLWLGPVNSGGPLAISSGVARIYLPAATDRVKHVHWKHVHNYPSNAFEDGYGQDWNASFLQPIKALRLFTTTGLTAGIVNWYGIGNGGVRG